MSTVKVLRTVVPLPVHTYYLSYRGVWLEPVLVGNGCWYAYVFVLVYVILLYDCADRKSIGSIGYIERAKLSYSLPDEPTSWCFVVRRKGKGDVTPLLWKARRLCRGSPR